MPKDLNENAIEWQIREISKGSKKTISVFGLRVSRAKLFNSLSPEMQDASKSLDHAWEDIATALSGEYMGHAQSKYDSVTGGIGDPAKALEMREQRSRWLRDWKNLCPRLLQDVVYALNQTEHTLTSYAALTGKSTLEIRGWYIEGLRVYTKLRGW
ncbi:hypothetical protein UFOVP353_13 [uncultured Caudovirales phage]|uniref:Uncharacterized protein n=1 Tax=uncultured Caudovirales phage TaxID=2100421 RepID=A0A6J5M2H6_9CAUD|nr:hypothetical protein UFOVP353_13 [uncultured Caudovirales phage]